MLKPIQDKQVYVSILGSDGTLRKVVSETTPGAVKREYETSDGKKGVKWEHIYQELSGVITTVEFFDGDFGKNLIIGITDGKEQEIKLSASMNSPFGEDLAKKLPAIDIKKPVIIRPYAFTDDNGKVRKGVSIMQDGNKVLSFFQDADRKPLHGYPQPQFKKDKKTGEDKQFSKDEWKIYFTGCRIFLTEYIEEHHLLKNEIAPIQNQQLSREEIYENGGVQEAPLEEIAF